MNKRLEEFSNHSIVIDGMLKNNTSETNIFSEMSRKSRTKGAQNLNLILLYIMPEPFFFSQEYAVPAFDFLELIVKMVLILDSLICVKLNGFFILK